MKRQLLFATSVFFWLALASCSHNASKPASTAARLKPNEGVLILSTQDDGSTSDIGLSGGQAANALFTLGLSELDRDFFTFTIRRVVSPQEIATKIDRSNKSFAHSYRSAKKAASKKWHVIPLHEGTYEIASFGFSVSDTESRRFTVPKNLMRFHVDAGESVYLGDLKIALKEMRMTRKTSVSYNYSSPSVLTYQVIENGPTFTSLHWSNSAAQSELSQYQNFPQNLRRANLNMVILAKYFTFIEKKRLEGIAAYKSEK